MGCGRYPEDSDKHIRGVSEYEPLLCFLCPLRGFQGSEDNCDLIRQMNSIAVVFDHPMCPSLQGLYIGVGNPKRLTVLPLVATSMEEMTGLTEIDNQFYAAALGEKYPVFFEELFLIKVLLILNTAVKQQRI